MGTSTPGDPFRPIARRYFRAAMVYLSLGLLLGAGMIWFGNDNFQFLHGHMLLVGTGLFAAYGAGFRWIASRVDGGSVPGMLAGSVLPVGLGLDRVGVLFGFIEAVAGLLFALLLSRALRST